MPELYKTCSGFECGYEVIIVVRVKELGMVGGDGEVKHR